ncbi:unnamed protein product, partial [Urochloa humidicola]
RLQRWCQGHYLILSEETGASVFHSRPAAVVGDRCVVAADSSHGGALVVVLGRDTYGSVKC